jgi:hypothetical protein
MGETMDEGETDDGPGRGGPSSLGVFALDVAFREGDRVLGEFDALIEQQRAQREYEHARRNESESAGERRAR